MNDRYPGPSEQDASESTVEAALRLYHDNRLDEAAKVLAPLVQMRSPDGLPLLHQSEALQVLGLIMHDLGQPENGASAFEKASLVAPLRDSSRVALASCYASINKTDLARELYLQLALGRNLPADLMLEIAAGLEAIDSPELAMQVCEWITEQDDSVAQAYYDMGFYSARTGNALYLTEALTHRALQLDPHNIHYRIGLVSLLVQLDRDDEALAAMGGIGLKEIALVTCISCLSRIAGMLDRCELASLASACRTRALELTEQKHQSTESDQQPRFIHHWSRRS